jgi:hypothetical protein
MILERRKNMKLKDYIIICGVLFLVYKAGETVGRTNASLEILKDLQPGKGE